MPFLKLFEQIPGPKFLSPKLIEKGLGLGLGLDVGKPNF